MNSEGKGKNWRKPQAGRLLARVSVTQPQTSARDPRVLPKSSLRSNRWRGEGLVACRDSSYPSGPFNGQQHHFLWQVIALNHNLQIVGIHKHILSANTMTKRATTCPTYPKYLLDVNYWHPKFKPSDALGHDIDATFTQNMWDWVSTPHAYMITM
jgi:hypothetical protein